MAKGRNSTRRCETRQQTQTKAFDKKISAGKPAGNQICRKGTELEGGYAAHQRNT